MKKTIILGTVFALAFMLVMPFVGGAGPSFLDAANAAESTPVEPIAASDAVATTGTTPDASAAAALVAEPSGIAIGVTIPSVAIPDTEHAAQKPVPKPVVVTPEEASSPGGGATTRRAALAAAGQSCPGSAGGGGSAPGISDPLGQGMITGTTTADIQSFAATYNAIRAQNCLPSVDPGNFRYDSCMEDRLFWIAEDPSTDPNSAWGHDGTARSDGVPARGCDGNLAGGSGNSGATVAQKWWDSIAHRLSLYRPSVNSTAGVCIYFAMVHGGIPNEPSSFTRAAARWGGC
jgi:hypothetical protein